MRVCFPQAADGISLFPQAADGISLFDTGLRI
jgi:hypothetical protein